MELAKAGFPLGEFVHANKQKAKCDWFGEGRSGLSPANQVAFFSSSREQIRQVEKPA